MKILDYETNKSLNDVAIVLSRDEAEELIAYLQRLTATPEVDRVFLSDIEGGRLEREISVALETRPLTAHVA